MKKIIFSIIFASSALLTYAQPPKNTEELTWVTDISEAYTKSKATQKPIFAFFTGSDWCGWCHKLQREVFAKESFIEWANKNVILLELDFPRKKQLPENLVQQNQSLQQFFGVAGYPTIWIFSMDQDTKTNKFMINAFGSLGYPSNATAGKEEVKFLENANKILATKGK